MDDDIQEGGDPAEAFDRLRAVVEGQDRELALLRRAVEGLAAERAHIDVPDYTETLGVIQQGVDTATGGINAIGQILTQAPALAMTPEQMVQRIAAAGSATRREDQAALAKAGEDKVRVMAELRAIAGSAWTKHDQKNRQLWFGLGGMTAGILLWMILPGLVARELAPTSWQWPEKLAARSLGVDTVWEGALRMAAAGSVETWNMMSDGSVIERENRTALTKCRKAAAAAGKSVKCTIMTGSADGDEDNRREE
ncbi:DUF6118 family protein [Sphingomonas faeni]|uniref:DUF6118 family protein n=1 Tax=Sphingomonas faeni TaxID=185950 RepID=UPI0020BDC933|nr:DUF6118 family protein [Sphingomonas faeni]MCK8458448.1 DUF6118 family protein [Sphingomonas faeni]